MSLILSLNAGSSSLKISLYNRVSLESPIQSLLTASISSIQAPSASFNLSIIGSSVKEEETKAVSDHSSAFAYFLDKLSEHVDIDSTHIRYVCHRVVHGGDFREPVKIDNESYRHIEHLSNLAPLCASAFAVFHTFDVPIRSHNGAALSMIKACFEFLPNAISIAYFDTCFHQSIPPYIYNYAIDRDNTAKRGLRKYGFHGLSYAYILHSTSEFLNKPPRELNLILLHLGSGASVCAIRKGVSFDTSMGFTPLSGLPGATRSGTVDPSLIFHYTNKAGRISHDPSLAGVTEAEEILNRKAGWKAMTGTANFKEIVQKADLLHPTKSLDDAHSLAFHLFIDRILEFVGAYHLKLGADVDALVFSGGIGEHSAELRLVLGKAVECLQYQKMDERKNWAVQDNIGNITDIGQGHVEKGRLLVCRTDEQFEMAKECAQDKKWW